MGPPVALGAVPEPWTVAGEASDRFAAQALDYDRYRPRYPAQPFDDLVSLVGLRPGDRAIEIGAGTGIATEGLVDRGVAVTAVEPAAAMTAVAQAKLADRVQYVGGRFEDQWPDSPSGSWLPSTHGTGCIPTSASTWRTGSSPREAHWPWSGPKWCRGENHRSKRAWSRRSGPAGRNESTRWKRRCNRSGTTRGSPRCSIATMSSPGRWTGPRSSTSHEPMAATAHETQYQGDRAGGERRVRRGGHEGGGRRALSHDAPIARRRRRRPRSARVWIRRSESGDGQPLVRRDRQARAGTNRPRSR